MAKKKDGKAGIKLPKEVAGVKIPKELRRSAEALIEKANSPAGRQMIGTGIAAAATAMAASAARAKAAKAAAEPPRDPAKPAAPDPAARVADAITGAAEALAARLGRIH